MHEICTSAILSVGFSLEVVEKSRTVYPLYSYCHWIKKTRGEVVEVDDIQTDFLQLHVYENFYHRTTDKSCAKKSDGIAKKKLKFQLGYRVDEVLFLWLLTIFK